MTLKNAFYALWNLMQSEDIEVEIEINDDPILGTKIKVRSYTTYTKKERL